MKTMRNHLMRLTSVFLAALFIWSFSGTNIMGAVGQQRTVQAAESTTPVPTEPGTIWDATNPDGSYKYADLSWYSPDAGEYVITTPEQLAGLLALTGSGGVAIKDKYGKTATSLQNFQNKTIKLGDDIDLSAHYWTGIRAISYVTIDGQGFSLEHVYLSNAVTGSGNTGFIRTMTGGALKNINIEDSYFQMDRWGGALVGLGNSPSINFDNCSLINSKVVATGTAQIRVGGLIGQLNGSTEGDITNCRVINSTVESTSTNTRHIALVVAVFSQKGVIKNCSAKGSRIIVDTNRGSDSVNVASMYAALDGANPKGVIGCEADTEIIVRNVNTQYMNVGGLVAGISAPCSYSNFQGSITVENCTTSKKTTVGGVAGTIYSTAENSMINCYNMGSVTVRNVTGAASDTVGGLAGTVSGNVTGSYSAGTLKGEGTNEKDAYGGLTGTASGTFKDCFYLNADRASGDGNNSGTAVNLASIKENGVGPAITDIQKGNDAAQIVLENSDQLSSLANADGLGVNFGIKFPNIASFRSSNTNAAVLQYTPPDDGSFDGGTVNVVTSKGKGGKTQITAKMQLWQNELINTAVSGPRYQGSLKIIEVPIVFDIEVYNIDMENTSTTSAINNETNYALTSTLEPFGDSVKLADYSLAWEYTPAGQESEPAAGDGSFETLSGLSIKQETAADTGITTATATRAAAPKFTTANNKATTSGTDEGWYRLKAVPKAGAAHAGKNFYSQWQYITLDDLMVVNTESSKLIELSRQDGAAYFESRKTLSATIQLSENFSGELRYQWFKDGTAVEGTAGTLSSTELAATNREKTLTYTYGDSYNDALSGAYQLQVTGVKMENTEAFEPRQIEGPSTQVKCYNVQFNGVASESGARYFTTSGEMAMTHIMLSADMVGENGEAKAEAYWIKDGDITKRDDPLASLHATLTLEADNTYTASTGDFMVQRGMEGENYQLVIYPVSTSRVSEADATLPAETLRFLNKVNNTLTGFEITDLTYPDLKESYQQNDLTANTAFSGDASVTGASDGSSAPLSFEKVSGPNAFTVDPDTGAIICTDPSAVSAGNYNITIKVTDKRFTNEGIVVTAESMSYQSSIILAITQSKDWDVSATKKNLYIYKEGYIFNESEIDEANLRDSNGDYITGFNATTDAITLSQSLTDPVGYTITVVSGSHVSGSRITLDGLTLSAACPITVKSGAAAEFAIKAGTTTSITGATAGIQSDGQTVISGEGTLNLSGPTGTSGSGSLSLNGATVNAAGSGGAGIGTKTISIESGKVTAVSSGTGAGIGGVTDGSVTIGGTAMVTARGAGGGAGIGGGNGQLAGDIRINSGNVSAVGSGGSDGIGSGAGASPLAHKATIINGGSVTAQGSGANVRNPVNDTAQNGSGKIPLHRVVLKVGETPEAYAGERVTGSTIWYGDTGTPASPAASWSAAVSGPDFQVDGASGGLLSMYLPYTAASAVSEDAYYASVSAELPDGSVYRRKVRANADDNLTASLLADMTYQLGIPAEIQAGTPENPVIIGHGVKADFDLSVESNIQEGRTVEVSLSPSKGSMGAWGTFIMNNTAASHNGFTPQYRVQTPGGVQLYTEGPFWTFSGQDTATDGKRVKQGSVLLSGSQTLYAGSYTGNMTWHAVWDDPVVGGE